MNDLVPERLDQLLSRSAIASEAGVSATTLANWTRREVGPLVAVEAANGDSMYTWRHLLDFCTTNPTLTASYQVLDRYRELSGERSSGPRARRTPTLGALATSAKEPMSNGPATGDGATLRAALRELKTEVEANAEVVVAFARLAEDAARVHGGLVERLQHLTSAVAAESTEG